MKERLQELRTRLHEVYDLQMAGAVLRWDQATYMPPGGAPARGRQLALLGTLAHARLTDPGVGRLLDALESWAASQPYGSDDASLVRVARREFEMSNRVPASLVAEMNEHAAHSYQVWTEARPANDFARVRPLLERTLDQSRRLADCFPGYASVADPLIDFADFGMKAADIRSLFATLRERLVPLVKAITERPPADDRCLQRHAPEAGQLALGLELSEAFGYDLTRGRQDKTHHPFMTKFSLGDVRITTRVNENDLTDCLFGTLHEAGHAMYEQGIRAEFEGTPLAGGTSSGVHESQSRLWENLVGRSLPFWRHAYPRLQRAFPATFDDVPLDAFYRAINKVQRSLVRTEADEVTYNLHVMIRFDLELDMLEGRLAVRDLPAAWHARYQSDLGLRAADDRDGALQDVHWYAGSIGGQFQGYTLGNILSAQFFSAAVQASPAIPDEIAAGRFAMLHGWLRENLYQHGAKFTTTELVERATGGPLSIEPYLAYLWGKYAPLYDLESVSTRA